MISSTQPWSQKVVVITGASSGFGKGVAYEFARRGARVVLAARRESLLDDLAHELEQSGSSALAVQTDVSRPEEVERLARQAIQKFGKFDIWINDAGVGAVGRFEEIPLADHEQLIRTNLLGTIFGSHVAMRHFRTRGDGLLINIASALGKIPVPYYASYCASKFGVVGLSAALRLELAENRLDQIHVCTVLPMATETPFFEHSANYTGKATKPVPPVFEPQQVIDAIIDLVDHPRDETEIGAAGPISSLLHWLAPGTIEARLGHTMHQKQIENSPPAPTTSGNIHQPIETGTEVKGTLPAGK